MEKIKRRRAVGNDMTGRDHASVEIRFLVFVGGIKLNKVLGSPNNYYIIHPHP